MAHFAQTHSPHGCPTSAPRLSDRVRSQCCRDQRPPWSCDLRCAWRLFQAPLRGPGCVRRSAEDRETATRYIDAYLSYLAWSTECISWSRPFHSCSARRRIGLVRAAHRCFATLSKRPNSLAIMEEQEGA